MAATALVQADIDVILKAKAEKILAAEGLTVADAIRMILIRTVREKTAPSALFTPNAETLEAIEEANIGNLPSFSDLESLKAYLHADD